MMQIPAERGKNIPLIVGGICISLLGCFGLAANRVLHYLKGRRGDMHRNGYYCAPSTGSALARAPRRVEANEDDTPFFSPIKRSITVTAEVVVGGRVVQAPIDEDDFVYFDERD